MQRGDVPGEIMPGEEVRQKYPCRKCLLREMDQNAYMESLYSYIARLEPGIKADETIYEKRLSVCKSCNYLNEGLCGACGCFVELRAVIAQKCMSLPEVVGAYFCMLHYFNC